MAASRFYWLLEVAVPGRVYRWSTEALEVPTAAGAKIVYRPGLVDLLLAAGDPVDVTVTDPSVDWPTAGPLLDGAEVVLRRWRDGDELERAEVFARGVAALAAWGTAFETARWRVSTLAPIPAIPDPLASVSGATCPPDGFVDYFVPVTQGGRYFPVVFGFPGYVGPDAPLVPCVPVPLVQYAKGSGGIGVLAAIEAIRFVVSEDARAHLPDAVYLRDGRGCSDEIPVTAVPDLLGRSIAVTAYSTADPNDWPSMYPLLADGDDATDGDEVLAAYSPDHGGRPAPRAAYDVVRYVLERWGGTTVDWARIPEVADVLGGFMVDTWLVSPPDDEAVSPGAVRDGTVRGVWRWLVDALGVAEPGSSRAPGLPVGIRLGADGFYLVPLRWRTEAGRTVRTVRTDGGEASRTGDLEVRSTPVNRITARYADTGEGLRETVQVGALANPLAATSAPRYEHSLATLSVARYARPDRGDDGIREDEVTVPWTWDEATAVRVGLGILERDALPWVYVTLRVPESWGLREGDQVRLVDDAVPGVDGVLALVDGPPLVGAADGVSITVRYRLSS